MMNGIDVTNKQDARHAASSRGISGGRIRPLEKADLEQIAGLFLKTFRGREGALRPDEIERVARYMEVLYFQVPQSGNRIDSFVYQSPGQPVAGFVGMSRTPYTLDGSPLSAGIGSALMAERGKTHNRVGAQLLWAMQDLDFDLIITDSANRTSLAFAAPLKFEIAPTPCLEWVYAFQPASMIVHKLQQRWPRLPVSLMKPLTIAGDHFSRKAMISKVSPTGSGQIMAHAVTAEDFACAFKQCATGFRFRPDWAAGDFAWILDRAAKTHRHGPLTYHVVRDGRGRSIGCFAFYGAKGRPARLLQLLAVDGGWAATLDCLLATALETGCIGVIGQAQDALMAHLYRFPGIVFHYAGGLLIRTRDKDLLRGIPGQDMLLGGLAGDRWTRLSSGEI